MSDGEITIAVKDGPICPLCGGNEVLLGGPVRPYKVNAGRGWESNCTDCGVWFLDEDEPIDILERMGERVKQLDYDGPDFDAGHNLFHERAQKLHTGVDWQDFEMWCLKATPIEMVDEAIRRIRENLQ